MSELPHGYLRYAGRGGSKGCRCEVCRAGKAAYMREKRADEARYASQVAGTYVARTPTHGLSAYQDLKCRCRVCRAAKSADHRRRRKDAS